MTRCEAYLDSKGFLRWWSQGGDERLPVERDASPGRCRATRCGPEARRGRVRLTGSDGRRARCAADAADRPSGRQGDPRLRPRGPHACTCRTCPTAARYLLAAAIRSIGFDAGPRRDSDERTLELGGKVTSGDECYPQKITVGDFLRMIEDDGRDKVAFLMPDSQRALPLRSVPAPHQATLDDLGYTDVPVITHHLERRLLVDRPVLAGPHPHGLAGRAGAGHPHEDAAAARGPTSSRRAAPTQVYLDGPATTSARRCRCATASRTRSAWPRLVQAHDASARPLPRRAGATTTRSRPLIGVVGEIFCRLNTFANFDLIRRGRGAGRRVLAGGHRRVGLVHRRRARPAPRRRGPQRLQGQPRPQDQVARSCAATSTPCSAPFADDFVGYEEAALGARGARR